MAKQKTTKSAPKKEAYSAPTADMFAQQAAQAAAQPKATPDPIALKDLFGKLSGWVKANPGLAVGTGLLGAGNVAGLMDNDYMLGQAGGAALGAAVPAIAKAMGHPLAIGGLGKANLAMAGGLLGSIFDNLRAKKAQEEAMAQQYYGG